MSSEASGNDTKEGDISPRQENAAHMLANGHYNHEAAEATHVSEWTVRQWLAMKFIYLPLSVYYPIFPR
jgi:DNA-binding NarL/FixJ family response regulator